MCVPGPSGHHTLTVMSAPATLFWAHQDTGGHGTSECVSTRNWDAQIVSGTYVVLCGTLRLGFRYQVS